MVNLSNMSPSRPLASGKFRPIDELHVEPEPRVGTYRSPCNLVADEVKRCITASTLESMFV